MVKVLLLALLASAAACLLLCPPAAAQGGNGKGTLQPTNPPTSETSTSFTVGGSKYNVRTKKWTGGTDPKCSYNVLFVIDNSGSMSPVTVPVFTAVNVAVQTLREKGDGRIGTLLFSDKPAIYGPVMKNKKLVTAATTDCHFCWKKSNLDQQPFPNPSVFATGSLTNLQAGIDLALQVIDKDVEGTGPAVDGPRVAPDHPYKIVLISDLVQTTGFTSGAPMRRWTSKFLRAFCTEDWEKYIDFEDGKMVLTRAGRAKGSDLCKGAVAHLHYILFSMGQSGDMGKISKLNNNKMDKMSIDDMGALWRRNAEAQFKNSNSATNRAKYELYEIFNGGASLSGFRYHSSVTPILHWRQNVGNFEWEHTDLVKTLLPEGCEMLEFDVETVTVKIDVTAPELPKLQLDIPPLVRHFPNDKHLLNPAYKNSLGTDSSAFLSDSLSSFRDQVATFKANVENFYADLDRQHAAYKEAANKANDHSKDAEVAKKITDAKAAMKASAEQALAAAAAKIESLTMLRVGGFASLKGGNADRNKFLSDNRALSVICLAQEVLSTPGGAKTPLVAIVGSFGHRQHCREAREMMGGDASACTTIAADVVSGELDAWSKDPSLDDEGRKGRAAQKLALEDEARKAEIHFQAETAAEAGFTPSCCMYDESLAAKAKGFCGTLKKCEAISTAKCAQATNWRESGWTEQHRKALVDENNRATALIAEIKAMLTPQ